jgi:anti-repressor protein
MSMATTALQTFNFEQADMLRAGITPEGIDYVIAADVCRIAGTPNVSQALARIDDDEKGLISTDTAGGKQMLAYVTESGFYTLVLSFRLRPEHANYDKLKRFRKWVTSEVLPAIRKTGRYDATVEPSVPAVDPRIQEARMLCAVIEHQVEQEQRLAAVEAKADTALSLVTGGTGFMTVKGFCRTRDLRLTRQDMANVGIMLSKKCKAEGVPMGSVTDEEHGKLNTYRVEVLERWLGTRADLAK